MCDEIPPLSACKNMCYLSLRVREESHQMGPK